MRTTYVLFALTSILASAVVDCSEASDRGEKKSDGNDVPAFISEADLLSNLTALSQAVSGNIRNADDRALFNAIQASMDAKNVTNLIQNVTLAELALHFMAHDDLRNCTIFTISDFETLDAGFSSLLNSRTEAVVRRWKNATSKYTHYLRDIQKGFELKQKELMKEVNDSMSYLDNLEVNLTTDMEPFNFKFNLEGDLEPLNFSKVKLRDESDGDEGTDDDSDDDGASLTKGLFRFNFGLNDYEAEDGAVMQGLQGNNSVDNTTACERRRKVCRKQCGGKSMTALNTCKYKEGKKMAMKCSCSSKSGSMFSFVTQISTSFGDDDDNTKDYGGDDDAGADREDETAWLGNFRPGPVVVLRSPWSAGPFVSWFNTPHPSFYLWSLGAASSDLTAQATTPNTQQAVRRNFAVLTNGGLVAVVTAFMITALMGVALIGKGSCVNHWGRLPRQKGPFYGEQLPLLHWQNDR